MSYMIIHSQSGLIAENQVQPSFVHRALKWWAENGMSGSYEAKPEPRLPKTEIRLANPHK